MRVGFVVYGSMDDRSGGYRYDRSLLAHLRARGDEVSVLSLPETSYRGSLRHNLDPAIRRRLRDADVDVYLQDALCHPSLVTLNARLHSACDAPLVALVHYLRSADPTAGPGWRRTVTRRVERRYLRSVDGFVHNAAATRSAVDALAGRSSPHVLAPPPRDPGRFPAPPSPERIRERAREGPLTVAFVGNVVPRKGVDVLLRGLARVAADWRLVVVGDRDADSRYAERMDALAAALGVADRVTFAGRLDDGDLADVLASAHLLCAPSLYEPYGMAALEAMGFGLPVVASRVGGADELVTPGETGSLVDPTDPGEVTDAVAPLASSRARLARLGVAARERYLEQPAWPTVGDRIRDFLRTLTDGEGEADRRGG